MTEKDRNRVVYWMLLKHYQWHMYIAATTEGLCYVGSHNAPFVEMERWVNKKLQGHSLVEDVDAMKPYAEELIDYLEGRRKEFILPMDLHGTPFQMAVWEALRKIPFGVTVSYTDIAERIGKPSSVRAVGTAIGANPVLITVPCHRVIAKSGKLTGYRGGLDMKEQLLGLEK